MMVQAPGVIWTVYVVRCRDRSLDTGITTDLERREPSENRSTASKREAAIKAMPRREKLVMIQSKTKTQ